MTQLVGHVGFLFAILSQFSSIAQLFFYRVLYQYSITKMSDNIEKTPWNDPKKMASVFYLYSMHPLFTLNDKQIRMITFNKQYILNHQFKMLKTKTCTLIFILSATFQTSSQFSTALNF